MHCAKCGKRAEHIDPATGDTLCINCLQTTVKRRFLKGLRRANPRRDDKVIIACRADTQSLFTLKTMIEVEKNYPVSLEVIELAKIPFCLDFCKKTNINYKFIEADYKTYTGFRLALTDKINQQRNDVLIVMPDVLEDIAAYFLGEVLLGDIRGLSLDASFRVAYPSAFLSYRTLAFLEPELIGSLSSLYLNSGAKVLLEEFARYHSTLVFSSVKMFYKLVNILREA
ncbi:MAG: hypothetical protein QW291_04435 [Thermofilaceae archaeon]